MHTLQDGSSPFVLLGLPSPQLHLSSFQSSSIPCVLITLHNLQSSLNMDLSFDTRGVLREPEDSLLSLKMMLPKSLERRLFLWLHTALPVLTGCLCLCMWQKHTSFVLTFNISHCLDLEVPFEGSYLKINVFTASGKETSASFRWNWFCKQC